MSTHNDEEQAAVDGLVLGPDEIVNYPLRRATRGYGVREVDDLLDQLAVQTQALLDRAVRAEAERDQLRAELAEASETETTLKKTLITAQRAAEASVAEAREQAEEMRQAATERVEAMLAEAAEQAHEMREAALRRARADEADMRRYRREVEDHVGALRTFADDHRARLRHHLELQLERLADMDDLPPTPLAPEHVDDEVLDGEVRDFTERGDDVLDAEGVDDEDVVGEDASSDDVLDASSDGADDAAEVSDVMLDGDLDVSHVDDLDVDEFDVDDSGDPIMATDTAERLFDS